MVSTNQRSINEGIRKVIGSSNRGFASVDPERQRAVPTQTDSVVPAGLDKSDLKARSPGTPGTAGTGVAEQGRR